MKLIVAGLALLVLVFKLIIVDDDCLVAVNLYIHVFIQPAASC